MVRTARWSGRLTGWILAAALAWLAVGTNPARADLFQGIDLNIEYWAGTGSNEAVMIVDFLATGGQSYAFGYRWDGQATGYDMVQAVAAAGALDYLATDYGSMGVFIDNFFYDTEAGNPDYYWSYWVGTADDGTVQWVSPSVGMSSRPLSDGDFDGWYNGFDGTQPRVPEPASVLLLGAGAGCWHIRRRLCGIRLRCT